MGAPAHRHGASASASSEITTAETPALPEGFSFVRTLGEGGFGRVVVARMTGGGAPVALKIASARQRGAIASLQRELDALQAISHLGIPRVLASGRDAGGDMWIAMSLLPGSAWPGLTPLTPDLLLDRVIALLSLLHEVHRAGFVHADLKPENILVTREGGISLIDFGLSFRADERSAEDQEVVGTVEYMSPEQCTPGAAIDARSDLYTVGVLLYAGLAGAPPFSGSAEEIREAHRSRRPPSLLSLGVPAPIDELVLHALAKNPDSRPATAQEFAHGILAIRSHLQGFSLPTRTGTTSRSPPGTEAAAIRETQRVAILWFESSGALVGLRQVVQEGGGSLVLARGQAYAAAYTLSDCENPIRAAAATGTVLLGRGIVERALVDVIEAVVQRRGNGPPRISSRVLRGEGRHLLEDDLQGLFATDEAACHIPEVERTPHPRRSDLFLLGRSIDPLDVTYLTESMLPLFGRAPELTALLDAARVVGQRSPGLATVVGDRGVGKTRLARELVELLMTQRSEARVVALKAPDPTYGSRENTLRRLLNAIVALPERAPDEPEQLLHAKLGVRLPPDVVLGVSLAMGWIENTHPAVVRLKAAPGAMRSTLAKALGEMLLARAAAQPLHVVVDDAQFLDDAALDAFEYATRGGLEAPLWICLFARVGFSQSRSAWGAHAGHHHRCDLAPLSPRDTSALIRSLLDEATNVSEPVVARLVERTKGIPLVVVELIRTLKRDGFLRRGERGSGWVIDTGALRHSTDVPLVQWLLDRELEALSPALRAHAALLAVLGTNFTIERASGLVRELERSGHAPPSELDPAVGVHRLRRAGLLLESGPNRYEFRNDFLREAAYNYVAPEIRRATHLAAYRLFAGDEQLPAHERLPQLAFHAAGAGLREEAIELELTLARRAVDRHDYLLAHESFHRALENLAADDPRHLETMHGLGLMRFRMGRHQDALRDLDVACQWAQKLGRRDLEVEILLDTATVLDWAEDYPTSRELVERAHVVAGDSPSLLVQARLLLGRGRSMFRLGDGESSTVLLQQAARVAETVGEEAYESRVIALVLAAPLAALGGDETAGRKMFEQLVELCNSHGDQLHLATTYLNRCVVWFTSGHIEPLQADLRQAIDIARAAGFPLVEMRALFNLGEIAYMLGDYEAALRYTRESIDLVLQISGYSQRIVVSRLLLARCHLVVAAFDEAREELERIRTMQAERRNEGALDLEFMPSDRALFRMVELCLEHSTDAQWDELIKEAATASMQQELVEVLELGGWSAERAGRLDRAASLYRRAAEEAEAHPTLLRARVAERQRALANGS